jgi:tetratricopeptide (TPR) repeat protein
MRILIACALLALFVAPIAAQLPPAAASPVQDPSPRERAFAAENQGRFAEAADLFLQLARAEPANVEWTVSAGRCLGLAGRLNDAMDLLDGARARFPGRPDIAAMLARTLLLKTERDPGVEHPEVLWADAAELAEQVLAVDPDHLDARLVCAQARYLLAAVDDARAHCAEAVRRHPLHPGAHVLLGRMAFDRFRALLRRHDDAQPTGQDAADLVGRIDAARQEAKREFAAAAALDGSRAHPHVALGRLASLDRRTDAARAHYVDALAIDPDAAADHAAFELELGWQDRAAAYADAAKRYLARPDARPAKAATLRFHEGRALVAGEQWEAAGRAFADVLAANPAFTNAHYYATLCAWRREDHDLAEAHAAAYAAAGAAAFADVLRSLDGDLRAELGAVIAFLGDRAYAEGRIDRSRDLNHVTACLRDSADAWNNYAFLCRETKRYEDALAGYEHALEREPDSPQLLNDAAVILQHHLGSPANLQKARAMYDRAIQLADKALADPATAASARERAAKAKRDALANLADLQR